MTTCEVVGGILLTRDQLFGVEQLTVSSGTNFINDGRLKIDEDGTGNVLASAGLGEECVESIITSTNGLIRRHLTIRLNTVLQTEEFPASVTDLDTSLADV